MCSGGLRARLLRPCALPNVCGFGASPGLSRESLFPGSCAPSGCGSCCGPTLSARYDYGRGYREDRGPVGESDAAMIRIVRRMKLSQRRRRRRARVEAVLADEAASFVGRLRDEVRAYVLGRMPKDPSGELAAMDLSSLLIAYGNWQGRYVRVRPRVVRESRELRANPKYNDHAQALAAVRAEISAGRDLTSRLSSQVTTAYVPRGERRVGKHRPDQDLLLGDWGIHHLHLGESQIGVARVARTADLLLAYFTDDAAYLIDIVGHPATDNWAQKSILRTVIQNFPELADWWRIRGIVGLSQTFSDEERLALRKAHVVVPVEIDGAVYLPVPAGLTTAGSPGADTRHVNGMMHQLDRLNARFAEDPQWLNEYYFGLHQSLSEHPIWMPHVHEDQCGALEEQSGCFVPFLPLRRA